MLRRDRAKWDALGALMQRLLASLEESGSLPAPRGDAQQAAPVLAPQAREWVLFYLAQHYDKLGQTGARNCAPGARLCSHVAL